MIYLHHGAGNPPLLVLEIIVERSVPAPATATSRFRRSGPGLLAMYGPTLTSVGSLPSVSLASIRRIAVSAPVSALASTFAFAVTTFTTSATAARRGAVAGLVLTLA